MKSTALRHLSALFCAVACLSSVQAAPGDLDPAFNPGANSTVNALLAGPDGRLLTSGFFSQMGSSSMVLALLERNGALVPGFDAAGIFTERRVLVLQKDGKILDGGLNVLRRLLPGGAVDTTFNATVTGRVNAIVVQPDGRLVIGGSFTAVNGVARSGLARVGVNGALDTSFNPALDSGEVNSLLALPDGRILVGGLFASIAGQPAVNVAMLSADGVPSATYPASTSGRVRCLALQPDGRVLVGGSFATVNGVNNCPNLARLLPDGSWDAGFVPSPSSAVESVVLQADGRILIAGSFFTVASVRRPMVARLLPDGGVDPGFDANGVGTTGTALGLVVEADGSVVAGGSFTFFDGVAQSRMVRLFNGPASQVLETPDSGTLRWMRGGSAPEVEAVEFEVSTNGGTTWQPAGVGARIPGGWQATGLSLPAQGLVRATGQTRGGLGGNSQGRVQSFGGLGLHPDVAITDPAASDADVRDGTTLSFALTNIPGSRARALEIRNRGTAALAAAQFVITGVNEADFSLSPSPVLPLAAAGVSPFSVVFAPTGAGVRTARLEIRTADPDQPVIAFPLTGTAQAAPTVVLGTASNVTQTTAVLRGSVVANGPDAQVFFEWGTVAGGGFPFSHVASPPLVGGHSTQQVNAGLTGLTPGTAYQFRLRAVNPLGQVVAQTGLFTTAAARTQLPGDAVAEFTPVFDGQVLCTALQPDGKMLVGGQFSQLNGLPTGSALVRLNADGSRDTSFQAAGLTDVRCVAVMDDGRVLAGTGTGLSWRLANGGVDGTRSAAIVLKVSALAVLPDGRVMVGGGFTGSPAYLARLLPNGAVDSSFSASLNDEVFGLALQPDGRVVVAGRFTQVGGRSQRWLARLEADGAPDLTFTPPTATGNSTPSTLPHCVVVQPDGSLLVSGVDFSFSRNTRRLTSTGTLNGTFSSTVIQASSLAPQADGAVVISGSSNSIRKVGATGTAITAFNNQMENSPVVNSLALQSGGAVVAGGSFSQFDDLARSNLALMQNDAATGSLTFPAAGTVLWQRGGAAPETTQVSFDLSTNLGATWTPLGAGTRVAGGWQITGALLPDSGVVRARARVSSGMNCGSSGLVEARAAFGSQPLVVVRDGALNVLAPGATVDLGMATSPGTAAMTFTVANDGNAALTGLLPRVEGAQAGQFTLTQAPAGTVQPAASTTFTITYTPAGQLNHQALLRLGAPGHQLGDITFTLVGNRMPALRVEQPAGNVVPADGQVDFGLVVPPGGATRLFTLTNTGLRDMGGVSVLFTGASAADFSAQVPAGPLATGQSVTFPVTFSPLSGSYGPRQSTMTVTDPTLPQMPPVLLSLVADTPLRADTLPWTAFSTTLGRPTWTRPASGSPPTSLSDVNAAYDVLVFTPPVTGSYEITCDAVLPTNWDVMLFVYQDRFDPLSPLTRVLVGDDDDGPGLNSRIIMNLQGGRTYHLVTTGFSTSSAGDYVVRVRQAAPSLAVFHPSATRLTSGDNSVNFGTVALSSSAVRPFTLVNEGSQMLRGLRAVVEGGPQAAGFRAGILYQTSLAEGESVTLNIFYEPTALGMNSQATLRILSDDPLTPSFTVALQAASTAPTYGLQVRQLLPVAQDLVDGSRVDFGTVVLGSSIPQRRVRVTNSGTGTLTGFSTSIYGPGASAFTMSGGAPSVLPPGAAHEFTLDFTPPGAVASTATVRLAAAELVNATSLTAAGTAEEPSYAVVVEDAAGRPLPTPADIDFGEVTQNVPATRVFFLRNLGTGELRNVALPKGAGAGADYTLPSVLPNIRRGARQRVEVRCLSSTLGARPLELRFESQNLVLPLLVRLNAQVITPAPRLVVRHRGMLQGQPLSDVVGAPGGEGAPAGPTMVVPVTQTGLTSSQKLVLENAGHAPLGGLQVSLAGDHADEFSLQALPVTSLAPGQRLELALSFTPTVAAVRRAEVRVVSGDTPRSPWTVPVAGMGFTGLALQGSTSDAPRWLRPEGHVSSGYLGLMPAPTALQVAWLRVPETQAYEVRSATGSPSWDNFLGVYEGGFDPSLPHQGLLAMNDDFGGIGTAACHLRLDSTKTYCVVTTGYQGNDQGGYQLEVRPATPVISVEQPAGRSVGGAGGAVDFGRVPLGNERTLAVIVRNIGGSTLLLDPLSVASPPDSSSVKYFTCQPLPVRVLEPQESTLVMVTYRPGVAGRHVGTLTLPSNDPSQPVLSVPLAGDCGRGLPYVGDVGSTPDFWDPVRDGTLPGGGDFTNPAGYVFNDDFFQVRRAGLYSFTCSFLPGYTGRVVLCLYRITLDAQGRVLSRVLLRHGTGLGGTCTLADCQLAAGTLYSLRVCREPGAPGGGGLAGGSYEVDVTPPADTPATSPHPVVMGGIQLTAEGLPLPLEDETGVCPMGQVAANASGGGATLSRVFTVRNTGSIALQLRGIRRTGADAGAFILQEENRQEWRRTYPLVVQPGGQLRFRIVFFARRIGSHTAHLELDTNLAGGLEVFRVQLTGIGMSSTLELPSFTIMPKPLLVFAGATAAFSAEVRGADPMVLQWVKDGANRLRGANRPLLVLPQVKAADAGSYALEASNRNGTFGMIRFSAPAPLGVVTRAPALLDCNAGREFTLTCAASASRRVDLRYRWFRDGLPLDDTGRITGAGTATLKVRPAMTEDEGRYHCEVTMQPRLGETLTFTPVSLANTPTLVRVFVPPVLRAISLPEVFVGQAVDVTLPADNRPAGFTITGLPKGISADLRTGRLLGRPRELFETAFKDFQLTITARNAAGATATPLRLTWRIKRLPAGVVGGHLGLLSAHPLNQGLGGMLEATVTGTGALTGTLRLGAASLPVKGDLAVSAAGDVAELLDLEVKRPPQAPLRLNLALNPGTGEMSGDARALGSDPCTLVGLRVLASVSATSVGRFHSGLIPPALVRDQPELYPLGEGFTILETDAKGAVKWSGKLADGAALTGSAKVCLGGQVPLFITTDSGLGSIHGWSGLDGTSGHVDGSLKRRKLETPRTPLNYVNGIPQHDLLHQGGRYTRPASGLILGLDAPTSGVANAGLEFGEVPGVLGAFVQPVQMSAAHALSTLAPVLNAVAPRFDLAKGIVTGTLAPSTLRRGSFEALVVPRLGRACGFHLVPMDAPAAAARLMRSGTLSLLPARRP